MSTLENVSPEDFSLIFKRKTMSFLKTCLIHTYVCENIFSVYFIILIMNNYEYLNVFVCMGVGVNIK